MLVYLDTVICIYAVEGAPAFQARARARLATLRSAGDQPAISDLTWLECRVKPIRLGDTVALADMEAFLTPDHGTEQQIHELRQGLRASYPGDRERAARRLGQLGPKAAEAVPTLIRGLKDASGPVRNAAVWALAAIGTPEALLAVERYEGLASGWKR